MAFTNANSHKGDPDLRIYIPSNILMNKAPQNTQLLLQSVPQLVLLLLQCRTAQRSSTTSHPTRTQH
jgi:hypothetical protein